MKTIPPVELQNLLAAHHDLALLDVRTPAEYAKVHIPRAQNIPLDQLTPAHLLLAKDQPVYLLCGSDQRAGKAAKKLIAEGFTQPVVIAGGIQAWMHANLPVSHGKGAISLERQVRIAAGSLVFTGVLLGYFVHPGFYGLAGFVGAGLVFAGVTDFCGMGLLLAKLPWNRKG